MLAARSAFALVLVVAARAPAATWYVASNGIDAPGCGAKQSPCRSISAAINQPITVAGDAIVVGPGRYGELNGNGIFGDAPGEETPAPGCGCMLAVNKPLSVTSSHGAASTIIDARSVETAANVALFMDGGEFGRPGKGFTVTSTRGLGGDGLVIDSQGIAVRGNQILNLEDTLGNGLVTVDGPQTILIEGNQIVGWQFGAFIGGPGKTVRKNHAAGNVTGFIIDAGSVMGNVATDNDAGFRLRGPITAIGNAAYGNRIGIDLADGFTGTVAKNSMVGNELCGMRYLTLAGTSVPAPNSYWGAPTGPGTPFADTVCGQIDPSPFSTKPINVKPAFKP